MFPEAPEQKKAQLIMPDELTRLKLGEIVFKVFRDQPCRTFLQPIFDKDLQNNNTFKVGAYEINLKTNPPDNEKLFYDLTVRDDVYDQIHSVNIPSEPISEEIIEEEPPEEEKRVEPEPPDNQGSDAVIDYT